MSLEHAVGELLKRPVETACRLIESLLGEPFGIAGAALADQVAFWQWKNRITIVEKCQRLLTERNLAVRVLPPEFLLPFVRECGDTSDETLQDAWARLLAAAVKDDANQHIGFIHILSELAANDAKVLQAIVAICPGFRGDGKFDGIERTKELADYLKFSSESIKLSLSNLQRLGLFNARGNKLSGFAKALLRLCLISPGDLDAYLKKEESLQKSLLRG